MKQYFLLPPLYLVVALLTYAEASPSACSYISADDIQTAFGKTVNITTDTPEICDYETKDFSVRVMHIDYPDEEIAKKGFKTLFAGKTAISGLGDEASSSSQGSDVGKVSMRQGLHVLSISTMGGRFDDDAAKMEALLRQASAKLFNIASASASVLDPTCEPILNASEAKLAQAAWHSTVESEGTKLESIKVDGQFFMNMDGKWQKSPMNLDEAEKIAIGRIKDGSFKVSECKDAGTDSIDGVDVKVLSYHSGKAGELGAGTVKLYIGKDDGLPYQSVMEDGKTTSSTRYKDVVAPKL